MCHHIVPQEAVTERLFNATIQTLELYGVYLGRALGLYRALHRHGPMNSRQLASKAQIAERYFGEWLEQQAVAGLHDLTAGWLPAIPDLHERPKAGPGVRMLGAAEDGPP